MNQAESFVTAPDPRGLVRAAYDRASRVYRGDDEFPNRSGYAHWLRRLARHLAPGARVLDLGCGCGVPVTRELALRYAVTGLDLSPVQIERARRLVPEAAFVCGDMTAAEFAPGSFDAVVAFYSIINVPLPDQPGLIRRIAGWVAPGGRLLAIVGKHGRTGIERNWRGVPGVTMYWSYADVASYRAWFVEAGLVIEEEGSQPKHGRPGFSVLIGRQDRHG